MRRRDIIMSIAAVLVAEGCVVHAHRAHPGHAHGRRVRRRVRRRIRRRWRRRVAWRVVGPRRALVVPVAVAVGWELALDSRVVIVREVRPTTVVVVDVNGGAPEEVEIDKEDTSDNTREEQGAPAAAGEPGRDSEEDVEEEVDE